MSRRPTVLIALSLAVAALGAWGYLRARAPAPSPAPSMDAPAPKSSRPVAEVPEPGHADAARIIAGMADYLETQGHKDLGLRPPGEIEKLYRALGRDALGGRVTQAIETLRQRMARGEAGTRFGDCDVAREWLSAPERGAREIEELLKRVSSDDFPEFRTELFELAGRLEGQDAGVRVKRLAERELGETVVREGFRRGAGGEVVFSPQLPVVMSAYRVRLEKSSDAGDAMDATAGAILAQGDPLVRAGIVSAYLKKNPDREEELLSTLRSRGVEDPESELVEALRRR